jgi:hypothetical protein
MFVTLQNGVDLNTVFIAFAEISFTVTGLLFVVIAADEKSRNYWFDENRNFFTRKLFLFTILPGVFALFSLIPSQQYSPTWHYVALFTFVFSMLISLLKKSDNGLDRGENRFIRSNYWVILPILLIAILGLASYNLEIDFIFYALFSIVVLLSSIIIVTIFNFAKSCSKEKEPTKLNYKIIIPSIVVGVLELVAYYFKIDWIMSILKGMVLFSLGLLGFILILNALTWLGTRSWSESILTSNEPVKLNFRSLSLAFLVAAILGLWGYNADNDSLITASETLIVLILGLMVFFALLDMLILLGEVNYTSGNNANNISNDKKKSDESEFTNSATKADNMLDKFVQNNLNVNINLKTSILTIILTIMSFFMLTLWLSDRDID